MLTCACGSSFYYGGLYKDVHDPGSISPFAAGMVITCEPGIYFYPSLDSSGCVNASSLTRYSPFDDVTGIYFYPSLLEPAFSNPEQSKYLNQPLLEDTYMKMGGFRLEDTILITAGEPDNLSAGAPRTAAEIEAFMAKQVGTTDDVAQPERAADQSQVQQQK